MILRCFNASLIVQFSVFGFAFAFSSFMLIFLLCLHNDHLLLKVIMFLHYEELNYLFVNSKFALIKNICSTNFPYLCHT